MACPNKNSEEYKLLVEQLGSDRAAVYTWKVYGDNYPPNLMSNREFKAFLGITNIVSEKRKNNILEKIANYNYENNTSHSVVFSKRKDGGYFADFVPNYVSGSLYGSPVLETDIEEMGRNNFEAWKGNNTLVENEGIQNIKTGTPVVVKAYHGTTHSFNEFKSEEKGIIEGHYGNVNYFTSDITDASGNYLSEDNDLQIKISNESDKLLNTIIFDYNNFDTEDDVRSFINNYDLSRKEIKKYFKNNKFIGSFTGLAEDLTKKRLIGDSEQVLPVYIKMNNPLVIGNGKVYEDFSEDVLYNALADALENNNYSSDRVYGIIGDVIEDVINGDVVEMNKLNSLIMDGDLQFNNENQYAIGKVAFEFFQNLGYDGIILANPSTVFNGVNIAKGTSHIHISDAYGNRVKLSDGRNITFSGETNNIYFQKNLDDVKGAYDQIKRIIYALTNPDITTFPHELAHAFERFLTKEERSFVINWVRDGIREGRIAVTENEATLINKGIWTRTVSESFARGFEVFLAEGNESKNKKLNNIFSKFADWLGSMLESLKKILGLELNDGMRNIYKNMLLSENVSNKTKAKITDVGIEKGDINVKNKKALSETLKNEFGIDEEIAAATAELFDMMDEEVKDRSGQSAYKDIKLNKGENLQEDNENLLFQQTVKKDVSDLSNRRISKSSFNRLVRALRKGRLKNALKDFGTTEKDLERISKANGININKVKNGTESKVENLKTSKGEIYGITFPYSSIWLDETKINANTPIHEFTHLYNKALKQNNPELYQRGIDLVNKELQKENSTIQSAIDYVRQTQPDLQGEALAEEILAQLTGEQGVKLLSESGAKTQSGILAWLKEAFEYIKGLLGLSQMTNEQAMNLTLEEYSRAIAKDLLSGNNIKFQKRNGEVKGAFNTLRRVIYLLSSADITTFPHELAHAFEKYLTEEERKFIIDWYNENKKEKVTEWTKEVSEAFATGFEVFLAEGNKVKNEKLNSILQKFAGWLVDIYEQLKEALGIELNDGMRSIYAKMLNSEYINTNVKTKVGIIVGEQSQFDKLMGNEPLQGKTTSTESRGDNLTYTVHNLGEYSIIEDSEGNIDYGEFETNEEAQKYIDENLKPKESKKASEKKEEAPKKEEPAKEEVVEEQEPITPSQIKRIPSLTEKKFNTLYNEAVPERKEEKEKSVITEEEKLIEKVKSGKKPLFASQRSKKEFNPELNKKGLVSTVFKWKNGITSVIFGKEDYVNRFMESQEISDKNVYEIVTRYLMGEKIDNIAKDIIRDNPQITHPELVVSITKANDFLKNGLTEEVEDVYVENSQPNNVNTKPIQKTINDGFRIDDSDVTVNRTRDGIYVVSFGDLKIAELKKDENGEYIDILNDNYETLEDNKERAISSALDNFNEKHNLSKSRQKVEEYYKIETIDKDGNNIEVSVKPIVLDKISTFEDVHGNRYTTIKMKPSTKEEFENQKELEEPTPKFNVGDSVRDINGDVHIIQDVNVTHKEDGGFDITYNTDRNRNILEGNFIRKIRTVSEVEGSKLTKNQSDIARIGEIIAEKFIRLFGNQIKIKIGVFDFDAPGRFVSDTVYINLAKVTGDNLTEVISHEFMHPFVRALKISNNMLYNNLVREMKVNNNDIIEEVRNESYEEDFIDEEALVRYLGRELGKVFNKNGSIKQEVILQRSLLDSFLAWLNDIIDIIIGKVRPKKLSEFVEQVNRNKAFTAKNIHNLVDSILIDENNRKKIKLRRKDPASVKAYLNKKEDGVYKNKQLLEEIVGVETLKELENLINIYYSEGVDNNRKFKFVVGAPSKSNKLITINETNNKYEVFISPEFNGKENLLGNFLINASEGIIEDADREEFVNLVNENLYINTSKTSSQRRNKISSVDFNPFMKLQDVTDFLMYQLSSDKLHDKVTEILQEENNNKGDEFTRLKKYESIRNLDFIYSSDELDAISELDAFMKVSKESAEAAREKIKKKLKKLNYLSHSYLGDNILRNDYNILRELTEEDINAEDFLIQYMQEASSSLNLAWRKYNTLIAELKEGKGEITKDQLRRMNKELAVIRNMIGFYTEFQNYATPNNFTNEEMAQSIKFTRTISFVNAMKNGMGRLAADLTVEWFTPYMDAHNEEMIKQGYKDEKYLLTEKMLRDHLLYGEGEESGFITYWIGANVTSKNPINAIFANVLKDNISATHADAVDDGMDINQRYLSFLSRIGIGRNNPSAEVDYYKKNFMRKATIKIYDKETKKEEYIEKWALHQKYYWDLFEKDLNEVIEKLGDAKTAKERTERDEKIEAWKAAQGYSYDNKTKIGTLTNPKYINKDYDKIKDDPFFQILEQKYNESNNRYGQGRLKFGIIPQKYKRTFWDKLKEVSADTKSEEEVKRKAINLLKSFSNNFRVDSMYTDDVIGFDGILIKPFRSNLATLKDDQFLNFNIHEIITDFALESRKHEVLDQTRYNADTLRLFLEDNKYVDNRKLSTPNVTKYFNRKEKYKEALAYIKRAEKDDTIDKNSDEYKENKKIVDEGVPRYKVRDFISGFIIPARTDRANKMLVSQINDIYYKEGIITEDEIKGISAKKLARVLSVYTSLTGMVFNPIAALSNVNIGNMQLFIEAHGGKYFSKKDLARATADYIKNIPQYAADLGIPIKSKDAQLALINDAIQGEIEDEFGINMTGSLTQKIFRPHSLFFMTAMGEHQIQLTNMKAMMLARKVETNNGEIISLYDAYIADENGRYRLRKDLKNFGEEDLAKFRRDLHGVNRMLNGNYSEFNKTMLQRQWFGTLMLKFRKYLYSSFRARWAGEHTDYERNTVEVGYLRYFFSHLINGLANMAGVENGFKGKELLPHQKYAIAKAKLEIGIWIGMTLAIIALFGGGGDDKKEIADGEKFLLLSLLRLRADLGLYHVDAPGEMVRQLRNPTASLTTYTNLVKFFGQLADPTEVYKRNGPGYRKGDSRLWHVTEKLIPGYKGYKMLAGETTEMVESQLSFMQLVNKSIKGVTPRQEY